LNNRYEFRLPASGLPSGVGRYQSNALKVAQQLLIAYIYPREASGGDFVWSAKCLTV